MPLLFVRLTAAVAAVLCFGTPVSLAGTLTLAPDAADDAAIGAPADAPAEREPYTFEMHWDNDGGFLKRNQPRDRYYTSGVALSLAHRPDWADDLAEHMPFAEQFGPARTAAGYTAGQLMFTPADITTSALQRNDRPYAGYLFAGVYWQRASEHTLDHFQLDLGLVGPSALAEQSQDLVHRGVGADEPEGWRHQLRDEPTLQFYVRKKWRVDLPDIVVGRGFRLQSQLLPSVGAAVGTVYRHVEAGAIARIGLNLPDDFGPGRVRDLRSAVGNVQRGWSGYGFVGVNGRLVEHNLFLDGNTWRNSHSVAHEPFVAEFQAGWAVQYRGDRWAGHFGYSQVYQTDEFRDQGATHAFGSLTASVTYWF